ncbi:MAG: FAD/NAD(P)-binding protein [Candidatus Parcubacteria bacterium]|nr:FAD/NAD(P)-binding protein [Candidatus Parcubacteria bacterium]
MLNEYKTYNCKILKVTPEASDSKTFTLSLPYKGFSFEPGQYVMASIPGFGEAIFGIASEMNDKKSIQITVRKVGTLTSELHNKKKGDLIGIRGPYGRSFPIDLAKGKNVLIVVGGIGIPPLRPLILDALENPKKYNKVYIFYGCRDESTLLYAKEYPAWKNVCELSLTLEKPLTSKYAKGLVTTLFDVKDIPADAIAFMCGPPIMYKFVLAKMLDKGFKPENIFISLERHMDCGQGVCQHCAIGTKYVCKDGPVFSYAELMNFKSWLSPI